MYRFPNDVRASLDRVAGIILDMIRESIEAIGMRRKSIDIDYISGVGCEQKKSTLSIGDDGCVIIHDGRMNYAITLTAKGMERPRGDGFYHAICGIMPSWSKIISDFNRILKDQAEEFDTAGANAKEFIRRFGCREENRPKFHVGDIAVFDPFSVDDEEYWDDYKAWKKGKVEILDVESSGHPFLHVKIRSLENPALVDWVDPSWLEI